MVKTERLGMKYRFFIRRNTDVISNSVDLPVVWKVMLCLLWFCFTSLSDWLKMLAPLSQPIRGKIKTNRDLLARVFPRLMLFSCICLNFSLVHFVFCSCCDWLE